MTCIAQELISARQPHVGKELSPELLSWAPTSSIGLEICKTGPCMYHALSPCWHYEDKRHSPFVAEVFLSGYFI